LLEPTRSFTVTDSNNIENGAESTEIGFWVTCAIMCQAGKGYSLWLSNSHEQEHPDAAAYCDD